MRVIEEKLKKKEKKEREGEGEIKLIPENLNDLWHLNYIIEPGDVVFSLTKRISESTDKLRSDKEKITVRLGIEVEKVEFHKFANRLRITGRIVAGVEDSGYHTINIPVGKELSIVKEWKDEQLKRIRYAELASKQPEVVVVTIEEGEAIVGILRQWGVEEILAVRRSYGKGAANYRNEFFAEVLSQLEDISFKYAVVAGPGFVKEDFLDFVKKKNPEIARQAVLVDASSIGTRGFIEVLKRGVLRRIAGEIRLAEEAEYMDVLLENIAKEEKAVYGLKEVKKAYEYGAIDVLLIADKFLREEREKWDVDSFMRDVESSKGKIVIMSTEFEPGKRLMSLGGIAALLRFKID